jgi:Flp pilus assembly protein TadG
LLLILLGALDIGRVFLSYIDLRNAVREGASYGSRAPADTAGIEQHVLGHSESLATGTTVTVNCTGNCSDRVATGLITVAASRQFQPLTTSFLQRFGLGQITIRCSASARVLS